MSDQESSYTLSKRLDRIETNLEKLSNSVLELSKYSAVSATRLNTVEKVLDKGNDFENTFYKELEKEREKNAGIIKALEVKIEETQKSVYMICGGVTVLAFLFTYGQKIISLIASTH